MTKWSKEVTPDSVWPEYPRPQMTRQRWMNLNGLWNFRITAKDQTSIPADFEGKILVPFCIESPLSGIMKPLRPEQRLWYQREVTISRDWAGQRTLLHFGAVDWEATLFIDGKKLGVHRGGYDNFTFDITKCVVPGKTHKITLSVWDPTTDEGVLRGKQALNPKEIFYTACSGIWQTVWLEPVPESWIERLKAVPDLQRGVLKLTVNARIFPRPLRIEAIVSDQGVNVASQSHTVGDELRPEILSTLKDGEGRWVVTSLQASCDLEISIPDPKPWCPDNPFLYDLTVRLKTADGEELDAVGSYFGMRTVGLDHDTDGNTRMLLNGQPVLMLGALDQGYWPDGVYLAPTDEALRFDIAWAKELGLNTLRKHLKAEPERWYYWADKLGMLIFQDMPSGNCGDPKTDLQASPMAADQWRAETAHIIQDKFNHPSIICWDLFNETFGGFDYIHNTRCVKAMDPSRLVNESSGGPFHGSGDVADGHGVTPVKEPNRLSITSEGCTPSIGCSGHQWPDAWSRQCYDPTTGTVINFISLYRQNKEKAVMPDITPDGRNWLTQKVGEEFYGSFLRNTSKTGLSGLFYCQLVDVETECNGLISYDREIPKVNPDKLARMIGSNRPKLIRP